MIVHFIVMNVVVFYSPLSTTAGDKSGAQHGAAARAYDCLSLRMYKPQGMNSVRIGHEEPYMTEQEAPPLPTIPDEERNKIEAERQRITNRHIATDGMDSEPTESKYVCDVIVVPSSTF
jgi:hypothetical protein